MTNTEIRRSRVARTFKLVCCTSVASLLFGCGPSEDASSTANNANPGTSASPTIARTNDYSIGDKISFAAAGNSKPFKVSGWSEAETKHAWTNGTASVIALRIAPAAQPLTLKVKCGAFLKEPDLSFQPVEVYANDEKIADWKVRDVAEYSASIPSAISRSGGLLTITLKIPKAISPKLLGTGEDSRLLGLICFEASLTPTQ